MVSGTRREPTDTAAESQRKLGPLLGTDWGCISMAGHKQMDHVVMAHLQKWLSHPLTPGMDGQRHWHISRAVSETQAGKPVHSVLALPPTGPGSISAATGTSALGDWRQRVRIRVTGSWAGRCSCGYVHVSSLFPMGSHSLGTAGSHHRRCRKGEKQRLWGKPHASQNMHLASEPRRSASTDSNNVLYHPTKGFPGNPFQTPRWIPDSFSCRHWCRWTVGRLLKIEYGTKFQPCQKQDDIL